MKNPKAKSIPFLDLNKTQVAIIDPIVNPKSDIGEAIYKKTLFRISDFSSYLNCQTSIRIPAMVAKILVMIMEKQMDNWMAGLPCRRGF